MRGSKLWVNMCVCVLETLFKGSERASFELDQVTHKDYVPKVGIRVNSRLRYDLRKNFIKSSVYIKKKLKIDDTTNLNMKVEAVGKVSQCERNRYIKVNTTKWKIFWSLS